MGQCRNLLPVGKLESFKLWLQNMGYEVRETKAQYSRYQVRINGKGYEVYVRNKTHAGNETVHASIYGELVPLAKKYLNVPMKRAKEQG